MTAPEHVYEILIKADPEQVWRAITDPEQTRRYLDRAAIETSLGEGSGYRYVLPGGEPTAEGVVEVVEPGRRLVLTWRALHDAELAAEPPSRVEWFLEAANDDATVTRLRLRHFDLGLSPATRAEVGPAWVAALNGLKTLLETGTDLGPVAVADRPTTDDTVRRWHRDLAVSANNAAWELLDGRDLSDDEAADLLGRAHASAHHWRAATGAASINSARAAWLCSRAHAVLGHGAAALRLADHCATLTAGSAEAADFDRIYAIEGRARALACLGRAEEARALRREAARAAAEVADPEDRGILDADLAAPPWFGL